MVSVSYNYYYYYSYMITTNKCIIVQYGRRFCEVHPELFVSTQIPNYEHITAPNSMYLSQANYWMSAD